MTRRIVALRHIAFEDLGSFETPLSEAGYNIEYVDVAEGDLRSLDPLDADLLVVLGGPIGVYDHAAYPFVATEIAVLKARLAADLPMLGICLGAQMMAAALGARVYPALTKEICWSALSIGEAASHNPLAGLRDVAVLHWHGDTFDLLAGTTLLASTCLSPNQAFARGANILGLQFHPEVLGARFEHWLLGHASELATASISPVELRSDARRYARELEKASAAMLIDWLSRLKHQVRGEQDSDTQNTVLSR